MSPITNLVYIGLVATTAQAAAPPPGPTPDLDTAYRSDKILLMIFGLFALFTLPRVLGRYSRFSEWSLGHIMYSSSKAITGLPRITRSSTIESTGSSTLTLVQRGSDQLPPKPFRSWSNIFHPISSFLGHSVMPGYSIGHVVIMLGYLAIFLYASLYKSNPFTEPARAGFVALAQMPIVFALGTKNNLLGMVLGVGYEKLNFLHRFVGRLCALAASMHALGFIYKWTAAGTFQECIKKPMFVHGLIALLGLDLLVFFSTAYWRERCYNVFLFSHIAGFIMFPVEVCFHFPVAIPWAIATASVYAFDHTMRLIKTRFSEATLTPIPELGMTRIEIPRVNAGWRAGQHVRIRVFSSGMGIMGWSEVHPFTIASIGGDGMVLMCKKAGGWTTKLYNMADKPSVSGEKMTSLLDRTCKASVMLEGPYGGVGHTMLNGFSGAVFVAGGSGITFPLAAMQDLVQKNIQGRSRVRAIHLVWCVQDPAALAPMLSTFNALIGHSSLMSIQISIFFTRASRAVSEKLYTDLPQNITITPGRPNISNILDTFIDSTSSSPKYFEPGTESKSGVVVGVCGPRGLGDQVRKVVGNVSSDHRRAVGGVELCEEIFGW